MVEGALRLAICCAGIYSCYLYYGILQEKIYRPDLDGSKFSYTFLLLALQCFVNYSAALLMSTFLGPGKDSKSFSKPALTSPFSNAGPLRHHSGTVWIALISFSYMLAMGASNQALMFVSYAFQALAKSCKMVPVMLANVFIGGKSYTLKQYCCVALITGGVVMFRLAKSSKSGSFSGSSTYGLSLLVVSLILDGFTSSNQRLFTQEYKPTTHQMMLQMNFWSVIFLLPILVVTGQGYEGIMYILPRKQLQVDMCLFAICSALGQNFIFYTITGPGPLAVTTITTTRKFFTILVSVFLFPGNSLNDKQWFSVGVVFLGLLIELHDKYSKSRKRTTAPSKKTD
mmetsp:Transcript_13494/g.16344  ORF Transcript_13494/g.16344 Transcript_13494/m.16344 type:complete len:342 (-) Transcript_13494:209-1234(-)